MAANTEALVHEKVLEWWDRANILFKVNFPYPTIIFAKLGTSAGVASLNAWTLKFNVEIMDNDNNDIERFYNVTVPHEISHLFAYKLYFDTGHGKWWKFVMRKLGIEPKRCHNYDVSTITTRQQNKYIYSCGCKSHYHFISSTRHNRVNKGAGYRCLMCNNRLVFTGKMVNASEAALINKQLAEMKK